MSMRVHPTWRLIGTPLRRMIRSRYATTVNQVAVASPEASRLSWNPEQSRLVIPRELISHFDQPAPVGQPGEVQYQLQQPQLFGAVATEFSPMLHSPWRTIVDNGETPDPGHYAAALLLDQVRAEGAETRLRPFSRVLMQSYLADDFARTPQPETPQGMLETMGISLYGRAIAGVVTGGDTGEIPRLVSKALGEVIGEEATIRLLQVVETATRADGSNPAEMLGLGQQWQNVVAEVLGQNATGMVDELGLYLWRAGEIIRTAIARDVSLLKLKYPPIVPARAPRRAPEGAREWAHQLDEDEQAADAEDKGGEQDEYQDTDATVSALPQNRFLDYRQPTDNEKRDAVAMSRRLRKLRYRRPGVTTAPSQIPQGRLNTRQLVQFTAQRKAGTAVTATPWHRPQAHQSEQPGLTCALVLDTSLSMRAFHRALSSLNWVLAQATTSVGGTISAWGFGGESFEIIRAGTTPRLVPAAADSGSDSKGAARALAHAAVDANLESTTGTRIAVVVTDAALAKEESAALSGVFKSLRNQGVKTLLLHVGNSRHDAGITDAELVSCPWGDDLAPVLSERIVAAYSEE